MYFGILKNYTVLQFSVTSIFRYVVTSAHVRFVPNPSSWRTKFLLFCKTHLGCPGDESRPFCIKLSKQEKRRGGGGGGGDRCLFIPNSRNKITKRTVSKCTKVTVFQGNLFSCSARFISSWVFQTSAFFVCDFFLLFIKLKWMWSVFFGVGGCFEYSSAIQKCLFSECLFTVSFF